MANNRVVVNFDFKANTQDIQTQLNSLKTNLQQIIGQSSKINIGGHINTQLKDAVGAAQSLQKHLTASFNTNTGQLDLAKFNASLKSSNQNVTMLGKQLLGAGAEGKAAFMGLATSLVQAEIPAVKLSTTMGKLMTTFANNARWMISSSVLTGFISGIREAVDYTKDLNESLTDIRIVTGKSSEEMNRLAKSANRMAKELKTSTAEIVKGQLIYYQQGDSAELAAKKAEITTKAANVSFGTSQEQMSEYLTAIWNSYQVGEENLEQFVDVLAAVGATTATSMEEIATAMQKVAATGNAVGVSYEQLTATIATISSITRTSSEQVGTALKTIYARIGDLKAGGLDEDDIGLGQVSTGLKKVGIEILDTNNNIRDMGEVVEEIGTKWEGWTEAQQQAIVQLIAGKRQYTQMMALFDNWDMYESTLATAEGADGELNKQQEIWAESWEAASQNVQASLESLYGQIFDDDVFIDFLNGLNLILEGIDGITDLFGGLGNTLLILSTLLVQRFSIPLADGLRNAAMQAKLLFDFTNKGYQKQMSDVQELLGSVKAVNSEEQTQLNILKTRAQLNSEYAAIEEKLTAEQKTQYKAEMQNLQVLQDAALIKAKNLDLTKQETSEKIKENFSRGKTGKSDALGMAHAQFNAEKNRLTDLYTGLIPDEKMPGLEKLINNFKTGSINATEFRQELAKIEPELANDSGLDLYIQGLEETRNKIHELQNELNILSNAPLALGEENQFNNMGADQAIQKYAQLKGQLEYYGNALKTVSFNTKDAESSQQSINTVLNAAAKIYADNPEKLNKISQALKATDLSAEQFEAEVKQLKNDLKELYSSENGGSGKLVNQFMKVRDAIKNSGGDVKELDRLIDELSGSVYIAEQGFDQMGESAEKAKGKLDPTQNKKDWASWSVSISSALMSLMSIVNAVKSAFDSFNNPDATGWEKFSAVISVVTTVLMSVSMLYPVVSGIVVASNRAMAASAAGTATAAQAMWASILGPIGIAVIAIAAVVGAIVAIGAAIHETDTEKLERLNKEVEEVNEKYNKQKSIIDELNAKKEAGADNQAQLDALDAEIKREERKLKLLEEEKKAKEEEKNKQEVKVEQEKYDKGGSASKNTYNDLNNAKNRLFNDVGYSMTLEGQVEYQKLIDAFEQGKISFQEIQDELQNNADKYFNPDVADEYADAAIQALEGISDETENNLQENLESLELFTKNGTELTDNFLGTFKRNLHAVYGDSLGSDAIAAIASYYSGIDEMSDKELQSLLEKLFPDDDKNTLVERFRQGLQEVDGEIDKFGKNQTLAKSLENSGKAVEKVQSALKEVSKDGFLAYSTIEEMGTTLDKAGVASAEWKQALYDANGNAEKTKEVLGQIVNEIINATLAEQNFANNLDFDKDGKLTASSQQYIQNVEKMIATQLRENGVLNAEEEAHKRVQAEIIKTKALKQGFASLTGANAEALMAEAAAAGITGESFSVLQKQIAIAAAQEYVARTEALGAEASAAFRAAMGYQAVADAKKGLKFDSRGGYFVDKNGKVYGVGDDRTGAEGLVYHTLSGDAKNLMSSVEIPKITVSSGSGGGGNNDPYWKQMYETNVARAEFLQKRDGKTDEWLGQQMDYWYNTYAKGHELEIKDPKTGETWEEYSFDEQKKAIEKKKSGVKKVFEDTIKDIERNSDSIDMGRVSTLLSDTLNKQTELGFTFSPEEKAELIDDYVSLVDGLMKEASSDLDTKFENQEFFSGMIDFDAKQAEYQYLLDTSQDYLKDLEKNGATTEQLAEYENSVVIPLIKKKRDLLKEEADAAKKATEHYIKQREFYGYKNGDNEIKARERAYKKMLNLTQEQILAEYGTYQEYWYALEEERLNIDQIFRDKLKEALEKEKDDRIAVLEAEKNAVEKLYEGESTLREKRKQINDQLQESLTMYQYLDKATRKLIFNEEDYLALSNTLNEIEEDMYDLNQKYLRDIVGKEADELEYINVEYERQNELLMNRYEIAEKELGIIKARTELENTLKERNTQMFINGRWQWVADQKAVIEAQKKLNDAEFDKETSELENEQELLINSFEKQIDDANQTWKKATKVLEDKVMTVAELMGSLSEPLDALTAQFYELATGKKITARREPKPIEDAQSALAKDIALAIIRKKEEYDAAKAQGDMTKAQEIEEQTKAAYQALQDLGYNELAEELHKSDLATAKQLNLDELTAKKQQTDEIKNTINSASDKIAKAVNQGSVTSETEHKGSDGLSMPKGYDPNFDYQAHINKLTAAGAPASEINYWKSQREKKIKGENLNPDGSKKAAAGTRFAAHALYEINEIGEETFVTPDGHFRNFAGGEVVFTHEQSQRLFSLLNADLFDINKMPRMGEFEQSNSNDTYISIGGISIDTTTQDGKDLVEILQRITNI